MFQQPLQLDTAKCTLVLLAPQLVLARLLHPAAALKLNKKKKNEIEGSKFFCIAQTRPRRLPSCKNFSHTTLRLNLYEARVELRLAQPEDEPRMGADTGALWMDDIHTQKRK